MISEKKITAWIKLAHVTDCPRSDHEPMLLFKLGS